MDSILDKVNAIWEEFPETRKDKNKFLRIYYQTYFNKLIPFGYMDNVCTVERARRQVQRSDEGE